MFNLNSSHISACMQIPVLKWLSCHAGFQEISRYQTGGESEESSEGIQPDFETQGRRDLKSKTGVLEAPQKELMTSMSFKKKSWVKRRDVGVLHEQYWYYCQR